MTIVCILAVDFNIFPRFLAKTELMGISLMDLGTGFFIFSSGLTSKDARAASKLNAKNENESTDSKSDKKSKHSYQKLFVLLLGFGRLLTLKFLNYQEHASEYGKNTEYFYLFYCLFFLFI
jgi:phosphatidylinositol glycan class W